MITTLVASDSILYTTQRLDSSQDQNVEQTLNLNFTEQ